MPGRCCSACAFFFWSEMPEMPGVKTGKPFDFLPFLRYII